MTTTPTPTEAIATEPGGDMQAGTANAHLETPAEIEALATDIAIDVTGCTLCHSTAADGNLDFPCPATKDGVHVLSEPIVPEVISPTWKSQHAKVLRFEVSIGKGDDARTIEEFEADVRDALNLMKGSPNNVTTSGGYYIIDGKVCLPVDYDPATRNRKPGTNPPSWAGGPSKSNGYVPPVPEDIPENESKEDTVRRLATSVGKQLEKK